MMSRAELGRALYAVANGNEAAFGLVYAATSAKLFGTIVRIVRRRDLAEDVLQEVYVRIWQNAHTFDAHLGSPMTWLVSLARHRALDEVRRKDAALPIEQCAEMLRVATINSCPFSDEDSARLAAALQRLTYDKRAMLVQAYWYGLTREEIARRTGRPVPTVKTRLRRALAELRGYLIEQGSLTLAQSTGLAPISDARVAAGAAVRA